MTTCASCGESNRENARFCAECGSPLHLTCSSCDATLSPRAKFCDQCGTPVVGASTSTPSPRTPQEAVRKTITIVFADLVGSTSFQERIDPETARNEMATFHRMAQQTVERHGGTIAKFIGDGVMAVFGVPDVAEDDADRAVRAGLDLQASFAPFADRIQATHGVEVGQRVGINTGEIVVAEDDDDMYGDALNTAARLEAACTPGRVLVGENTWRLTRSNITYEVLGEVEVKGKAEPVATFQVVEAAPEVEEKQAPFVGRQHELTALIEAVDACIEERRPVLVSVIGSPGVGKTRLAAEARTVAAPHADTFDLRVDRTGNSTFEPIADLVRRATGLDELEPSDDVIAHLTAWADDEPDAAEVAAVLATFVGAAPARSTEESFWASRRLIEIMARRRPTVIVVDDIQWAQALFLDLLGHLVEWVEGPAALICLARPEIREIRPALAQTGRRVYDVVSLEGLGADATAELAAGLLGTERVPPELIERLPVSTEGNPLFVRELVLMLVDDGVIEEVGGEWVLAVDADAVEVPPTIQSLLQSRVERMPADERRVVELAGVIGSEFARGAVESLLPLAERHNLDDILGRLRRKEIIDDTGTYWGDEPILRFHHVLIRDASYRRLLKQRRADIHVSVADWTQDAADRFGGEHEITIGFHYEQAHQLRTELGSTDVDTEQLGVRGAELLHAAADRALAQDDLAAAGALAERALACLPSHSGLRAPLRVTACEAFFSSGDMRAGQPHLDALRSQASGDDRLTAWADAFEGQRVWATEPDRLDEIETVVAAAADRLGELGDDAGVAKARLVRALILARIGRVGDCESELDTALTAARTADDRRRITAVLGAAPLAALWGPSPVARAGGRCLDIIRLLRITAASPMVESTSVRCQAVLEAMRGRFEQARDLIARAHATVEELGIAHGVQETAMFAGIIELYAGDPAAAEPHLRQAYAGLGRLGVGADAGQAAALLSRSLLAQGQIDEAADLADESARLAGRNLQTAVVSRTAQAEIALAQHRPDDAVRFATEAVAIAADTDLTIDHAAALATLARAQDGRGDENAATITEREAHALFEAKGAIVDRRGDAASAEGGGSVERAAGPEPTLAERSATEWFEALNAGDIERLTARFAEDFVGEINRELTGGMTLTRSEYVETSADAVATFGPLRYELLASRGEHHSMARVTNGDDDAEFAIIVVGQVDGDGISHRITSFDTDDLLAAEELLDQWYAESLPDDERRCFEAGKVITAAQRTGDGEALEAILAPDFVSIDHRIGGYGTIAREMFVDRNITLSRVTDGFTVRTVSLRPHSAMGAVAEMYLSDSAGNEWRFLVVGTFRDGQATRSELFDIDDYPAAIARYEFLTRGQPEATLAERQYFRIAEVVNAADADALRALTTPDLIAHLHRDGVGGGTFDRDQYVTGTIGTTTTFGVGRSEVIATRGEYLVMGRSFWGDEDATEMAMSSIGEFDSNGLLRRLATFNADALDDAEALLDEWYADSLPDDHRAAVDWTRTSLLAQRGADPDLLRSTLAPGFTSLDHRTGFGFGRIDADEWVERIVSFPQVAEGLVNRFNAIHRINARGCLAEMLLRDRADHEWRFLIIGIVDGERLTSTELFDCADFGAAVERFGDLTAADDPGLDALTRPARSLTNHSSRVGDEFYRLVGAGDTAAAFALLAPGWYAEDHRSVGFGGVDPRRARDVFESDGFDGRCDATVVAVRGANLALFDTATWYDGIEFRYLWLNEIDADGVELRGAAFDAADLTSAIRRMDEWNAEGEGAAYRAVIDDAREAADAALPDTATANDRIDNLAIQTAKWLTDRVNAGDNLTATTADGTDHRAHPHESTTAALVALGANGRVEVEARSIRGDHFALARASTGAQAILLVLEADDGRFPVRIDVFDDEDPRAAETLAAWHGSSWLAGEQSTVDRYLAETRRAIERGDGDMWKNAHRADFRFVSYRAAMPVGEVDLEMGTQTAMDLAEQFSNEIRTDRIEILHDRVGVFRLTWGTAATMEMVWVAVFVTDEQGQGIEAATFEEDELAEAIEHGRAVAATIEFAEDDSLRNAASEWARTTVDGASDAQVLAVMYERFAFLRTPDRQRTLVVALPDGDGEPTTTWYSADRFGEARDAFTSAWRALLPQSQGSLLTTASRVGRAMDVGDAAALRSDLSATFVLDDHRRLGFGRIGREQLIELHTSDDTRVPHRESWARRVIDMTPDTVLFEQVLASPDADWQHYLVLHTDGTALDRMEAFDELDEARLRFDALATDGVGNLASQATRRLWTAVFTDRDIDKALEAATPDGVSIDRRRLVASPEMGVAGVADFLRLMVVEDSAATPFRLEVLAETGDHHALVRVVATDLSNDIDQSILWVVTANDEGLLTRGVAYSDEDEPLAQAELEGLAPTNRAHRVAAEFWSRLIADRDLEAALELNDPEYETHDRRRLVGGTQLNADEAGEYAALVLPPDGRVVHHSVDLIEPVGDDRALIRLSAADADGAWSYEVFQSVELGPTGLIRLVVSYSLEDEAAAHAELHQTAPRPTLAERTADAMFAAFMEGDAAAFLAHTTDDLVVESHRSLAPAVLDRELLAEALDSYRSFYPAGEESTVATRGDHWAVTRVIQQSGDGLETEMLLALEFDDAAKLRRLTSFDGGNEEAATRLLDEWFVEATSADTDPA